MSENQQAISKAQWEKEVSDILDGYFSAPSRLRKYKYTQDILKNKCGMDWPGLATNELRRRYGAMDLLKCFSDEAVIAISRGDIDMDELLNLATRRSNLRTMGD